LLQLDGLVPWAGQMVGFWQPVAFPPTAGPPELNVHSSPVLNPLHVVLPAEPRTLHTVEEGAVHPDPENMHPAELLHVPALLLFTVQVDATIGEHGVVVL
jgi:hypothetical protein